MKTIYLKLTGLMLAVLLLCGGLTAPASAAFDDIADEDTAFAVSVLEAFGIVGGYPDGGYHPNDMLTRAQFCKMAILLLDLEDQVLSASQKTLFADVTSSHWAAGYVNLAYSRSLIQGYGNGYFGPDDNISYEQAVTIALRILGYEASDIGDYYPDDYLRFADKIGLTASLDRLAGEAMTRGETAQLLYTLLCCKTKSGSLYADKLASQTVKSVILLDSATASPDGVLNCAKFYSNGQAVWYPLAADVDDTQVGSEGMALLNDDGELIAFLPDGDRYTVVDGILLSNSYRSSSGSYGASAYSVKLYTNNNQTKIYPRANTISANLVGCTGTLLLNENGYATAFISDDVATYNLTSDAILLNTNATSDTGVTGCAEFLVGGKTVWYRQTVSALGKNQVGLSGTILYDEDGYVIGFLTDVSTSTQYDLLEGIYLGTDTSTYANGVSFYCDGDIVTYPSATTLASNQIGYSGRILLNEQGYVSAFMVDSSEKYSIVSDAIMINASSYSDSGTGYGAKFYVDGKTAWYAYASSSTTTITYPTYGWNYSTGLYGNYYGNYYYGNYYSPTVSTGWSQYLGYEGTILLDSNSCIVDFLPTGDAYRLITGVLLDSGTTSSNYGYLFGYGYSYSYVTMYVGGQTVQFPKSGSIATNATGASGTLLVNAAGYAVAFISDSSGSNYSTSQSGILLSTGQLAADGSTVLAQLYVNGNVNTYAVSGSIPTSYIGQTGKLVLDGSGCAVSFMVEQSNGRTVTVSTATETQLVTADGSTYTMRANMTVIDADQSVTTWGAISATLTAGSTVVLYFDSLGSLSMVMIG